jgi:spore coat protein CotH
MEYLPSANQDEAIFKNIVRIAKETPDGCFVEVGVYKGGTASYLTELAEQQGREVYLYDTFTGMPYKGEFDDRHNVGDFSDTNYDVVREALPYANVIKGIFPQSAVEMPKIAFAHIDVDQYQGYIDCINYLSPLMAVGGVMWFDDYVLSGAQKAIKELIPEDKLIDGECGHQKKYIIF